jgi:uncharacterized membrane protein
VQPDVLVTILGMAVVTFAIRLGGYLLADRLPTTGFVAAWMRHIPGAVLASLVGPAVVAGGPDEWIAAAATAPGYALTRTLFFALAAGVGTVVLARMFLPV